ncbi:MAG: DNA polymerase IV [Alkalispirochaetaceae bacterium]
MSWFFHVDMDAFYASVEQLDNPELRGKPVIVGGRPGSRGVVAACSYEARLFGVHSAMPTSEASRLCPEGIFLPVRMKRYQQLSRSIMGIFGDFTPEVRQISVDEAFLDMSGTERLLGPVEESASTLKKRVKEESGLTISVGVAPSRYLAKLASDFDKPDGLCIVRPGEELGFIDKLPLNKLWGVGRQLRRRLESLGYDTPEKIREESIHTLRGLFGASSGEFLHKVSRGEDPGIYSGEALSHSVSAERTFESDIVDQNVLEEKLLALSEEVMERCYDEGVSGAVVLLKLRDSEFNTVSGRRSFSVPIGSSQELYLEARKLFLAKWNPPTPLRLLGVGVGKVLPHEESQGELFDQESGRRQRRLEQTVHELKRRFGDVSLGRASRLTAPEERNGEPEG